ncbi:MAG TPA: FAD-dependent oxidoreductase [Steroidobacteraceae bacterium]|jgi:glycine/D-amino acid oxidase-like deaminating enzyme|nr:FAD-dependent oxidoreductase [Steroidobacteraceae bacterium]
MRASIGRRELLAGAGAAALLAGLDGCATSLGTRRAPQPSSLQLTPIRASTDRITRITVCTRPFRAQGPRLDTEKVGSKLVVHNYGHGGSGWSLSWGSSTIAARKAMATGEKDIAVIGCGALGLTSALLLQRAGARVTIYAKELPPDVRSSLASGLWTPDSRICLEQNATPAFKQLWESMARTSFQTYQNFLGLPGAPVEFIDSYFVADDPNATRRQRAPDGRPPFADLQRELIGDLMPRSVDFAPGSHSLGARYLRRSSLMMFNLTAYARLLMGDFIGNGGKIEIAEFHTPRDFARLREKTLINATGFGARALFADETVIPVRGQLARTMPQTDIGYGLFYKGVSFVPRRDGLVFQDVGNSDYYGFNDDTAVPDRVEADRAVNTIAALFAPSAAAV